MFENLSDPILGELVGHPDSENWTGKVEVRTGETTSLLISYSGGEDVDLSIDELLEFARSQLTRIRKEIDRFLKRVAKEIRKEHPQRNKPNVKKLSEADLAATLKIASIQFNGSYDTAILITHKGLKGEIVLLLTPSGKIDSVEF